MKISVVVLCALSLADALCLTRKQCSSSFAVCTSGFFTEGNCQACSDYTENECKSPCLVANGTCTESKLAFDLNLDLKAPFYFQLGSGVSKPTLQTLLFPPHKTVRPVKLPTKGLQLAFCGVAGATFLQDAGAHWRLYHSNNTFLVKLSEWAIEMSCSSNMAAAAAAMGFVLSADKLEGGTEDSSVDLDSILGKKGAVFKAYVYFLIIFYFGPLIGIFFFVIPTVIIYCWVVLLCCIVVVLMAVASAWLIQHLVVRFHGTDDLAEALLDTQKESTDSPFFYLCLYSLLTTMLNFWVIMQSRYFGGDGYFDSIWLTFGERHLAVYANGIRASMLNAFNFVGLFF